jgi:hypothetical protein
MCNLEGACTFVDGTCIPASSADCLQSEECREIGNCGFDKNRVACVPTVKIHCEDANVCAQYGKCSLDAGTATCVAASPEDCKISGLCKIDGQCAVDEGPDATCVATSDKMCRTSDACKREGRCSAMHGVCVATSAKDCKKSKNCKTSGDCALLESQTSSIGMGLLGGASMEWSALFGSSPDKDPFPPGYEEESTPVENTIASTGSLPVLAGTQRYCGPKSDTDCKKSKGCAEHGKCHVGKDQGPMSSAFGLGPRMRCMPTSDEDCKKSKACKTKGLCCLGGGGGGLAQTLGSDVCGPCE